MNKISIFLILFLILAMSVSAKQITGEFTVTEEAARQGKEARLGAFQIISNFLERAFSVSGEFEVPKPSPNVSEEGGAGGGGSVSEKNKTKACEPNWKCGEWGKCTDFMQERKCIDLNNCFPERIDRGFCVPEKEEIEEILERPTPIFALPIWILLILLVVIIFLESFIIRELRYTIILRGEKHRRKRKRLSFHPSFL